MSPGAGPGPLALPCLALLPPSSIFLFFFVCFFHSFPPLVLASSRFSILAFGLGTWERCLEGRLKGGVKRERGLLVGSPARLLLLLLRPVGRPYRGPSIALVAAKEGGQPFGGSFPRVGGRVGRPT